MYKFVLFSALVTILSFVETFAQNEHSDKSKFILSDFYMLAGEFTQKRNGTSIENFQKFLPQSKVLKANFSDYSSGGGGSTYTSSIILSVMACFRVSNSQKRRLRLGVSVFSNEYVRAFQHNWAVFSADTFTSQSGEKLYTENAVQQQISTISRSQNIRLDVAYIYQFLPERRLSFFTGVGIGVNVSMNAHTDIYYSEEYYITATDLKGRNMIGWAGYAGPIDAPNERLSHKGNFGVNLHVPLGLDFRLSNNGFLQKTHLIYEFTPGFNGQFGGIGDYSGRQWEHKVGLKFALK